MDSRVFLEWIKERRVVPRLPIGCRRVLYLDNCNGHALSEDAQSELGKINTTVRFSLSIPLM